MRKRSLKMDPSKEFKVYMDNLNHNDAIRMQPKNDFHVTMPKETFTSDIPAEGSWPTSENTSTLNGLHTSSHIFNQKQSLPLHSSLNDDTYTSTSKDGSRKRAIDAADAPAFHNGKKQKSKQLTLHMLYDILLLLLNLFVIHTALMQPALNYTLDDHSCTLPHFLPTQSCLPTDHHTTIPLPYDRYGGSSPRSSYNEKQGSYFVA